MELENYQKYKWFYTSSKKLVIGGKSAKQNDELLKTLKREKEDYIVMHTSLPGSPFSVILSDIKKVTKSDLEQTAIFTGSFSRAWRSGKKRALVDIFKLSQLYKKADMKTGTWGVKSPIKTTEVSVSLVLAKQKEVLRAVPEGAVKKKDIILSIVPGKVNKEKMLPKFAVYLDGVASQQELLSALPAGGVAIVKSAKKK